jgi:tetratricopeptide (TPR) repeat protein/predicted MPP superfamily phosphohydrolase
MVTEITWLHLSDLHFCQPQSGWDATKVLSTLITDLKRMQSDHGLRPDLIFFTGDLAFGEIGTETGYSIRDQFAGAARVLDRIRSSFQGEITRDNVFLVPGNHDVNRCYVTDDQTTWLDNQTDTRRVTELIQTKTLQWRRYIERLQDYRSFLANHGYSHLLGDPERLTYGLSREIRGGLYNIVGLNTAWSCCRDSEKGKLWMGGRWQIGHLTASLPPADLSIALMHHPSNWLVEYEDPALLRDIEREFDFSLHGHEHQDWVTQGASHTRIAAGACYDRSDKENGYNFVRLNLDTGKGEVWLRRYHGQGGDWIPEVIPNRTDHDGLWQLAEFTHNAVGPSFVVLPPPQETGSTGAIPIPITRNQPFRSYGPDLRPVVDVWVGREAELAALEPIECGVVVATGIGGQGKSGLVSKFLESWITENPEAFWDWRDCREEGERFLTQLIAMIEHLTEGAVGPDHFSGADTKAIVRYMFELLGNKKGVVVLDNVDFYVNEADGKFSLGVGVFVEEALRVPHQLLVILTCRPRVAYANPRFFEIPLQGIRLEEAIQLFSLRGVKIDQSAEREIEEIWARTDGHPLWLNLIAVQMNRSPQAAPEILQELRKQVDDRTRSMFRALWKGLISRQQTVLRCMAELSYPETQEAIQYFVGNLIKSPNQFNRAFEGIKTLSLVVERGFTSRGKTFDLHPLVRSFIRTEYPTQQDRLPYIRPILIVLAQFIKGLAGPSESAALEDLQRWTTKAELEVAANDDTAALETLFRTADQLIARAFHEEFFRVAKLLLDKVEWTAIEMQDSQHFHSIVGSVIRALGEHDREAESRSYLRRYEEAVGNRTVARLRYCRTACYVEWVLGNYPAAIALGREGMALKTQSGIDTQEDISNSLALALRDSGNIEEALKIFAGDQPIEDVLLEAQHTSGKDPSFYGNIGRCLQFNGEVDDALLCYVKSSELLQKSSSANDVLNRGYAALWIGEVLESVSDFKSAFCFYRLATSVWTKRSPLLVGKPMEKLQHIHDRVDENWSLMSNSAVDKYCRKWITEHSDSYKKSKK